MAKSRTSFESISYTEALEKILARALPLSTETVGLDAVLHRITAEAIPVSADDPPAAKSAMDGFALRSRDTAAAVPAKPMSFRYEEVVGAGHVSKGGVAGGGAVRIMTGALMPPGADAVVKQEDTRENGPRQFTVAAPLHAGENVVSAGAAMRAGQPMLPDGEPVGAQGLSLLASQGITAIQVRRRPRLAVLSLGDELVEPGNPLQPGQLYVSNSYGLGALASGHGAETRGLGIAPDDPERIEAVLKNCLPAGDTANPAELCDIVVTLGGTLQGDFDFVADVLERLGAELHFRRTRINMGGSTLMATLGRSMFFGLPGSPMPSWLAFETMVRPALWAMAGRARIEREMFPARLSEAVRLNPDRTYFLPCRLEFSPDAPPSAQPLTKGMTLTLPPSLLANGLIHWPDGQPSLPAGAEVPVEWLGAN